MKSENPSQVLKSEINDENLPKRPLQNPQDRINTFDSSLEEKDLNPQKTPPTEIKIMSKDPSPEEEELRK